MRLSDDEVMRALGIATVWAFLVISGYIVLSDLNGRRTRADPAVQPTFEGFEVYLHQRGCVVSDIANSQVTRYRCDGPQSDVYIPRMELLADYRRVSRREVPRDSRPSL